MKFYFSTQILLIPGFTGLPVVTLFFLVPWMSNRAFMEFLNFLEYNLRLVNYICVVYLAFFPAANIYPGISSFLRTLPCSQRLMNGIHHVFIKLQRCLLLESEHLTNPSTRIRRRVFIICNWVQFTLSAPTFNLAWESTDNQVHHCLKIMIQHAHESDLKQYLACHSASTPHESLLLYNRSLYLFNRVTGIEISLTCCDSDKHVIFLY